jgi:hypothetical protein
MARRIREYALQSTDGAPVPGGDADGYVDKVVKYVPADVIAAWTTIVALIKAATGIPTSTVLLICLVIGLAVTYWWTWQTTKEANQPPQIKQAIVATIAFLVWALALGDLNVPLTELLKPYVAWNEIYPKALLILFTLVSGKI